VHRRLFSIRLAVVLLIGACGQPPKYREWPSETDLKVLKVGQKELSVEVAEFSEERRQGLMYRDHLAEDCGMLFVYPEPKLLSFWMKNTAIPLSIVFFSDDGIVINIEDMNPFQELPRVLSRQPARFALEAPRGWFATAGIQPGDKIELPEWVQKIDAERDPG